MVGVIPTNRRHLGAAGTKTTMPIGGEAGNGLMSLSSDSVRLNGNGICQCDRLAVNWGRRLVLQRRLI